MIKSITTVLSVALVSACLAHLQNASGQRETTFRARPTKTNWVRTVDGWENSAHLWLESSNTSAPSLHPGLVAGFQLSASLFALIAFPGTAKRR